MDYCRFCKTPLEHIFVDLGMSPIANDYITINQLHDVEKFYPLCVYVCSLCLLVQLPAHTSRENIFTNKDYAYFSSYSSTWVNHANKYVDMITQKLNLTSDHFVIEVASNDGYLLQFFKEKNIPLLGIEPAKNVAEYAKKKGINTLSEFFGEKTGIQLKLKQKQADLIIANNVIAHVPNLNDFIKGFKQALKPDGIITIEFQHLYSLIKQGQFDIIYQEHFSYLSLLTLEKIFFHHDLIVFDVDELSTQGGSLRVYATHKEKNPKISMNVHHVRLKEEKINLNNIDSYKGFAQKVYTIKYNFLTFLVQQKKQGKKIIGYGAPAKGNTFLNFCGIRTDFLDYTVDKNPYKQEKFLPGTHIPIRSPQHMLKDKPDLILILPWNLAKEITKEFEEIFSWGGSFFIAIPHIKKVSHEIYINQIKRGLYHKTRQNI